MSSVRYWLTEAGRRALEVASGHHKLQLQFSSAPAGIHLLCSCGFDCNLGFNPSLSRVNEMARDHLKGPRS